VLRSTGAERTHIDRDLDLGSAPRLTLKSATEVTPLLKRVARDLASEFDKEAAV
jgi:hypothetical protein